MRISNDPRFKKWFDFLLSKSLAERMNIRHFSIVIPHYEKRDTLEKVLDELRIQINPEDEIIIVDDHSPNGVPDCECPNIKIIQPEKRVPHIYRLNTLRNTGIKYAKNDTIIILDPDCIPNPHFMKWARRIRDSAVLFAGLIDFVRKDGSILSDPRGKNRRSRWVDLVDISSGMVWGGCMMFNKSRTKLIGWFDTSYDEHWGAEDHDFGARCFHSGMRIRYEPRLAVVHQYHEKNPAKIRQEQQNKRNLALWKGKLRVYSTALNVVTPYVPAVSVNIVTMLRPYFIEQCVRSIFRSRIPLRLYLVNQGDNSKKQADAIKWWKSRWAVKYIYNEEMEPLTKVRNEILLDAKKNKMKYHITLDDDTTVIPRSIETLVRVAEENPEYNAIAGYIFELPPQKRMLGGYIDHMNHIYYDLPQITNWDVTEVEYLSTGFTLIRLNSLVLFDEDYEFGWDDWDWSLMMRQKGLKLGVCGKAGVTHRILFTPKGMKKRNDSPEYRAIRFNGERRSQMDKIFKSKWGHLPSAPKLWSGAVLEKLSGNE